MSKSLKGFEALESYKTKFGDIEENIFDDIEDIERELNEQASNYEEDEFITLSDYTGPEYGSGSIDTSVEVENRGGLRYIDINFSGENFEVNQEQYEDIKRAIDSIIEGESDSTVELAINEIVK